MARLAVDDAGDRRYIATVKLPQSVLAQISAGASVSVEFGSNSSATVLHVDGHSFQLKSQPEEELLLDCLMQRGSRVVNLGPVLENITVPKVSANAPRKRANTADPRDNTPLAWLARLGERSEPVVALLGQRTGRGRGRGRGHARERAAAVSALPFPHSAAERQMCANVATLLSAGRLTELELRHKLIAARACATAADFAPLQAALAHLATQDSSGRYSLRLRVDAMASDEWEPSPPRPSAPHTAATVLGIAPHVAPAHAKADEAGQGGDEDEHSPTRSEPSREAPFPPQLSPIPPQPAPSQDELSAQPSRKRARDAPRADELDPAEGSAERPAELHGVRIDWADPFGSARASIAAAEPQPIASELDFERASALFEVRHRAYLALRAALRTARDRFDELSAAVAEEPELDACAEGVSICSRLAARMMRDAVECVVLHELLRSALEEVERFRNGAAAGAE